MSTAAPTIAAADGGELAALSGMTKSLDSIVANLNRAAVAVDALATTTVGARQELERLSATLAQIPPRLAAIQGQCSQAMSCTANAANACDQSFKTLTTDTMMFAAALMTVIGTARQMGGA